MFHTVVLLLFYKDKSIGTELDGNDRLGKNMMQYTMGLIVPSALMIYM
jgi:hypothetical protein